MLRWLPENVSTYGADIDWIFYWIYYVTSVSLVLVLATDAGNLRQVLLLLGGVIVLIVGSMSRQQAQVVTERPRP